ncbi:MAG: homoserine kinase [Candidatus Nanopelagicaceae bacterium]|jgi:homoserine kinase|nr:homoserine kinase [Actinomycetota bacterium]NCV43324.1 homoserine kinase [Actinomycetota bacterium]NCV83571.1 homoserine kinase [Actinomycetota bacterium]NCV95361.1 homoserine kinase [Actinomycetota bacterium]NCW94002.1 homoserine kinase [Actinomycetota bacterium]
MARGFKDRLTYKATPIQVSVPASSANLGPGFDALALALDIRDIYVAQILDEEAFDVDVTGEGAEEVKRDGKHLVIKAMMRGFEFMGGKPRGIALRALNQIPHGRGLGSSAAAIVGGLNLARSLVLSGNSLMNDDDLIALATDLEGHPDNVAAAALGGATISWMEERVGVPTGCAVRFSVEQSIRALLLIPNTQLSTGKARKMLPEMVPHRDATINAGRSALLVHALTVRPDLLYAATEDHLHQQYRREGMPKSVDLVNRLRGAGVAAMISGAGPSVLVLHNSTEAEHDDIVKSAGDAFRALDVELSPAGAQVSNA